MPLADDLLAILNDPTHMWSHALKEASRDSQRLFLTLALFSKALTVDDLQIAYSEQNSATSESFMDSLRALEDSFVKIRAGYQGIRWVDFRNPSLQDFSHEHLNEYSDWLDTLLSTPMYYEQIIGTYKLGMSRKPATILLKPRGSAPPIKTIREGDRKFDGIHRWLRRHHGQIATKAIDLALSGPRLPFHSNSCLLYTSDAADDLLCVDL